MGHTPFGYKTKNGIVVIDDKAAGQIKSLYQAYLSGDALRTAAIKVGIEAFHAGIGNILKNPRYLDDAFTLQSLIQTHLKPFKKNGLKGHPPSAESASLKRIRQLSIPLTSTSSKGLKFMMILLHKRHMPIA